MANLQRLLLARALIHRPDLLVLDEPAQGVDVAGADVLHQLIEGIRADLGCGILLISHDLQMVMKSDSDVVVLCRTNTTPRRSALPSRRSRPNMPNPPGRTEAMLDDFLFRALLAGVVLSVVLRIDLVIGIFVCACLVRF